MQLFPRTQRIENGHMSNFDIESDDQMTVLWYVEVYTIHPSVGEWRDMGHEWYEEDDADTWVRDVCTQQIRFGYANLTVFRVRARVVDVE